MPRFHIRARTVRSGSGMGDGSIGSGGTGFVATGRELREACEARVPETR